MFANLSFVFTCTHIVYTMDFMTPPMFDSSNVIIWKTRMSIYLQTQGLHVYHATTKKCYLGNRNHIGANAQALEAIRSTLSKVYLMLVSNLDSALQVEQVDDHNHHLQASNANPTRGGI